MFRHLKGQTLLNSSKNIFNLDKQILNKDKKMFTSPRRYFSNGFGGGNNPLSMLPTITRRIVIANCIFFGIGLFMNNRQYITEFFYHKYALSHNKYHVLITSHFAKANFFDFLIETFLTGMLGSQLETMMGSQAFLRLVGASVGIGSLLLITMHKEDSFFKSEAIFRGIVMYYVLSNPNTSFFLFPLPIQIKAMWVGILIVGLDFLSGKWANFGGLAAAFLLTRRMI
jgi:membrane associated rhomboid family serine protease